MSDDSKRKLAQLTTYRRAKIDKRTDEEKKGVFLAHFMDSYNKSIAARAADISIGSVEKWLMLDRQFKDNYNELVLAECAQIESEIKRRAIAGVQKDVWYRGEIVGEVTEFSDQLLMFYAKAKMPDQYRDKLHVEKNTNTHNTVLVLPSNSREFNPNAAALPETDPSYITPEPDSPQMYLDSDNLMPD